MSKHFESNTLEMMPKMQEKHPYALKKLNKTQPQATDIGQDQKLHPAEGPTFKYATVWALMPIEILLAPQGSGEVERGRWREPSKPAPSTLTPPPPSASIWRGFRHHSCHLLTMKLSPDPPILLFMAPSINLKT